MLSHSTSHFPQFVFTNGEKLLWNPIIKKAYQNRPEERVRLRVIEYLIHEVRWSKNRISTEAPIKLRSDKGTSRTDVICYDKNFDPFILIECKSEDVSINEKTAQQIARYNTELKAPYLMMTNGLREIWCNGQGELLDPSQHPMLDNDVEPPNYNEPSYWSKRGFISQRNLDDTHSSWCLNSCQHLYVKGEDELSVRYIEFESAPPELYLATYYRQIQLDQNGTIAVGFSSTPSHQTQLIFALRKNESMKGILIIPLHSEGEQKAMLYNVNGETLINNDTYDFESITKNPLESSIQSLSTMIDKMS